MYNNKVYRKTTKLSNFDYSTYGAYFVTICTHDRKKILSEIEKTDASSCGGTTGIVAGEGLAPPEYLVRLKACGKAAKEQLLLLETRYDNVTIKDYVIMPDHIHAVIALNKIVGAASRSPTLNDVICTFKSLTSRVCKQKYGTEKIFQRSYADHIIRDENDYAIRRKYIYENPTRWYYKYLIPEDHQEN